MTDELTTTQLLRQDLRFKRVKKRCLDADQDVDTWLDELMTLHASRGMRSLNSTALLSSSQRISIDTNLDNQTVRSRAVEICMRALRQELFVDEQLDYLRKYLHAQYATDLKHEHKTVADRKTAVEHVLNPLISTKKRLASVGKIAELVVSDCDAAGFALKRIGEVLAMKSVDR